MATTLEEVASCNLDGSAWLWGHGWQDKRKFKGHVLSNLRFFDSLEEHDSKSAVIRGKVKHGWVITVIGDIAGCGWDMTTYFCDKEPQVIDGKWDGDLVTSFYDTETDENDVSLEVADGPHLATWLEL